jgi:hypothetical protein
MREETYISNIVSVTDGMAQLMKNDSTASVPSRTLAQVSERHCSEELGIADVYIPVGADSRVGNNAVMADCWRLSVSTSTMFPERLKKERKTHRRMDRCS